MRFPKPITPLFLVLLLCGTSAAADALKVSAEPRLLAPGSISSGFGEYSPTWDNERQQLIFMRRTPGLFDYTLYESSFKDGRWSTPEVLPFSGEYRDAAPFLSPDGNRLVFDSRRPTEGLANRSINIWMSTRSGGDWTEPELVEGASINAAGEPATGVDEFGPVLDASGQLYFYSFREPYRGGEHFVSTGPNYAGATPVQDVPDPSSKTFVSYFYLSPEATTLVMEGASTTGSDTDLFYACRNDDGWTKAMPLETLNTTAGEGAPYLSSDGEILFFVSDRQTDTPGAGDADIYVVSTKGLPIPCKDRPSEQGGL